jgi:hypothetical protein
MSEFLAPCRSSSKIGRDSAKRGEHKLIQPMDELCDEKESPSPKNDFSATAGDL